LRSAVNATRRNMAPGNFGGGAGCPNGQWQYAVTRQRVGFGQFASVHVWLAGVTGAIDDELGFVRLEKREQGIEPRVIYFRPGKILERQPTPLQFEPECCPDVAGAA